MTSTDHPPNPVNCDHARQVNAPDGSTLRLLARNAGGSMSRGRLEPGGVSRAVAHRAVDELWYVLSGAGEFFCSAINGGTPFPVAAGVSLSIPAEAVFQFRATGPDPLEFITVTMPPWPGDDEARLQVNGPWRP